MKTRPLLIVSDSVSCSSGLGRVARDLASRVHEHLPGYRVATAGYGGQGARRIPFREYHFHSIDQWLLPELPQIANDWADGEELTIMFIWDLSRVYWFANPKVCPQAHVRQWLESAKLRKWIYHPIDAEGPNGGLSVRLQETMKGFDRVLDYTGFSARITGNKEHLPHGIDSRVFRPYDRLESKRDFRTAGFPSLADDSTLIGIVGTNQARKNWSLGIKVCRALIDKGMDIKIWMHIDVLERFWSIPSLIADYDLGGRVVITNANFSDEQMAKFYSACDLTLGIGLGEGYGFPLFESLACGVPVIHGDYGGGAEFLPPSMKVKPLGWYDEGPFCCKRPVFDVKDWAECAEDNLGIVASLPPGLDWNGPTLLGAWMEWFEEGL